MRRKRNNEWKSEQRLTERAWIHVKNLLRPAKFYKAVEFQGWERERERGERERERERERRVSCCCAERKIWCFDFDWMIQIRQQARAKGVIFIAKDAHVK